MEFKNNHFYLKLKTIQTGETEIVECGQKKQDVIYNFFHKNAKHGVAYVAHVEIEGLFYFFDDEKIMCELDYSGEEIKIIRKCTGKELLLFTEMPEETVYAYNEDLVYRTLIQNKVENGEKIKQLYAVDPKAMREAFHRLMDRHDEADGDDSEPVDMEHSKLVLVNL